MDFHHNKSRRRRCYRLLNAGALLDVCCGEHYLVLWWCLWWSWPALTVCLWRPSLSSSQISYLSTFLSFIPQRGVANHIFCSNYHPRLFHFLWSISFCALYYSSLSTYIFLFLRIYFTWNFWYPVCLCVYTLLIMRQNICGRNPL